MRSKYSPKAEQRAASFVAPLPLVKHIGESASRTWTDQTCGTGLRQEAISILIPSEAISAVMFSIVSSSEQSLPRIGVLVLLSFECLSMTPASCPKTFTISILNSGPC